MCKKYVDREITVTDVRVDQLSALRGEIFLKYGMKQFRTKEIDTYRGLQRKAQQAHKCNFEKVFSPET